MVCTKLHCCIDSCDIRYTFHLDESCFIDHRNKDTVYYETCCFINLYRCLSDFFCDLLDCIYSFSRCIYACDHFY